MCLASLDLSRINAVKDGPAVSQGLKDTAALCRADQSAIAARFLTAAAVIDGLLAAVAASDFVARLNQDTIIGMQRGAR